MNSGILSKHAVDGTGGDAQSLRRIAALLHCKTIGKDVKDCHGSNKLFNHIQDVYILASRPKEIKPKTLAELH
jgi:hypothetical protein